MTITVHDMLRTARTESSPGGAEVTPEEAAEIIFSARRLGISPQELEDTFRSAELTDVLETGRATADNSQAATRGQLFAHDYNTDRFESQGAGSGVVTFSDPELAGALREAGLRLDADGGIPLASVSPSSVPGAGRDRVWAAQHQGVDLAARALGFSRDELVEQMGWEPSALDPEWGEDGNALTDTTTQHALTGPELFAVVDPARAVGSGTPPTTAIGWTDIVMTTGEDGNPVYRSCSDAPGCFPMEDHPETEIEIERRARALTVYDIGYDRNGSASFTPRAVVVVSDGPDGRRVVRAGDVDGALEQL